MPRKTGLGRGLSALIPDAPTLEPRPPAADSVVDSAVDSVDAPALRKAPATDVAIERVVPNPQQPRSRFDSDALAELV